MSLHDVVVVGAGPVGAAFALALAESGLDVLALDARPEGAIAQSDRSLALSHGSRLIFERLGVWGAVAANPQAVTPITAIDISQRGGFGSARIEAAGEGLPALGYVVSYRALQAALDDGLRRHRIPVRHGTAVRAIEPAFDRARVITDATSAAEISNTRSSLPGKAKAEVHTRLAVVADGGGALVPDVLRHRHDYHQTAVTAKLWMKDPHGGLAFERFTPEGPMALLPDGDHYGLVWTATPPQADGLLAMPEAEFLIALQHRFGARVNGFMRVDDRRAFPLRLDYARDVVARRTVLIGNAAQSLHPVAGQGFNLGVRDAYELAQELLRAPSAQTGDGAQLARYAASRRIDRASAIAFTRTLLAVFGNDARALRFPRGLALTLLDSIAPAKRALTRTMLFGWH